MGQKESSFVPQMRILYSVVEVQGKFVCYIQGVIHRKDFPYLVYFLQISVNIQALKIIEGPNICVCFLFEGDICSLIFDSPHGYAIQNGGVTQKITS